MSRAHKRSLFLFLLLSSLATTAVAVWAHAPSWSRAGSLGRWMGGASGDAPSAQSAGTSSRDRAAAAREALAALAKQPGRRPPASVTHPCGTEEATPKSAAATYRVFTQTQHGPFDDIIFASAQRWGLDAFVLKGLLANESKLDLVGVGKRKFGRRHGRRRVISGGALGIAQFTATGIRGVNRLRQRRQRRGAAISLLDARRALVPQEAIPAAAELLAHLVRHYGRDGGITAYNSGARVGRLVSRLGFWRARRAGRLRRFGGALIQGHRFLPNVLRRSNGFRQEAGLDPLPAPDAEHPESRRLADREYERSYPRGQRDADCAGQRLALATLRGAVPSDRDRQ